MDANLNREIQYKYLMGSSLLFFTPQVLVTAPLGDLTAGPPLGGRVRHHPLNLKQ